MVKLFFSYSHKDEDLRNEMEKHLSPLQRQGVIEAWHDRRITAGKEFGSEISQNLEDSQIILLLISSDFIASNYCYEAEMGRAIELHNSGKARVIPVILRPCDWQSLPFGKFQALPIDGKPATKYTNLDDAFLEVGLGIRAVAHEFDVAGGPETETPKRTSMVAQGDSPVPGVRSSNLRVKKTFTQREKDKFERAAYEYIEKYFENSLRELQSRNPNIETEFRRIDANHFTATAYVDGAERSSCVIKFEGRGGFGGISYAYGNSVTSGLNESLSVEDDGYVLYLKAMAADRRFAGLCSCDEAQRRWVIRGRDTGRTYDAVHRRR